MDNIPQNGKLEWESPQLEILAVEQTAHNPGTGLDGDFFPDCAAS